MYIIIIIIKIIIIVIITIIISSSSSSIIIIIIIITIILYYTYYYTIYTSVIVIDFLSTSESKPWTLGGKEGFYLMESNHLRRWAVERRVTFWSSWMFMLPGILLV